MAMMLMMVSAAVRITRAGANRCAERLIPGVLVRILLAVIHLLLERLGLFLVAERQASKAVLQLKGVEEDTILVVGEGVIDLLVPYHAPVGWLRQLV
jgi:hypothetical protein